MTIIEDISNRMAGLQYGDLPASTVHAAKRSILDWFSATIPGSNSDYAARLQAALSEDTDTGSSDIFGQTRKASARSAAFLNGTVSHLVELDDIFRDAIYHPGCPVIAAAFALGQSLGANGRQLIAAVVNGYEVSTRIGVAVQPEHYRNWHTTGTVGCFGAATAAATLLGLDKIRFAHALSTVGTFTASLQQAFRSDTMSKPLHAGRAAEAGITAALLACEGFTGALDILEGASGFGAATAGGKADWSRATSGLREVYNIEQMTVKNHACCGHSFAAIDGALELQKHHGFTYDQIEHISIATYQTALDVVGGREINTAFQGKFSLAFCVASALVHGSIRLDAFNDNRLRDPQVHALMQCLDLQAAPELTELYPNQRSARMEIRLRDGTNLQHFQPHRKGDPELPLDDADLNAKFTELAIPVVGQETAARIQTIIWGLEEYELPDCHLNWA